MTEGSMQSGQTVFVTGAGRGLGRAMATEFAARGARVAMIARSAPELAEAAGAIAAAGGHAATWVADVTDAGAVRQVVRERYRLFGHYRTVEPGRRLVL